MNTAPTTALRKATTVRSRETFPSSYSVSAFTSARLARAASCTRSMASLGISHAFSRSSSALNAASLSCFFGRVGRWFTVRRPIQHPPMQPPLPRPASGRIPRSHALEVHMRGMFRNRSPSRAGARDRPHSRCGSRRGPSRGSAGRRSRAPGSQIAALSIHISGVWMTKRASMPRLSASCIALIVSSRQSG